jgi:hypothetical protein
LPGTHLSWESKGGKIYVYSFWIFQSIKYVTCDKNLRKTCMIVKLWSLLLWHSTHLKETENLLTQSQDLSCPK